MTTLVCPACGTRWKIVPDGPSGDVESTCPNHAPCADCRVPDGVCPRPLRCERYGSCMWETDAALVS